MQEFVVEAADCNSDLELKCTKNFIFEGKMYYQVNATEPQ